MIVYDCLWSSNANFLLLFQLSILYQSTMASGLMRAASPTWRHSFHMPVTQPSRPFCHTIQVSIDPSPLLFSVLRRIGGIWNAISICHCCLWKYNPTDTDFIIVSRFRNIGAPLSGAQWSRVVAILNDLQMFCPANSMALQVSNVDNVFKYRFNAVLQSAPVKSWEGVPQGSDLKYLFPIG
jgi:hypothetical protein